MKIAAARFLCNLIGLVLWMSYIRKWFEYIVSKIFAVGIRQMIL
jgi:hypothetical protein